MDDPTEGALVLFGGLSAGDLFLNDTWTFSGDHWTNVTNRSTTSPSARFAPSMVYDSSSQEVVLFGGQADGGFLNDTWTYQGMAWTLVPSNGSHAPSGRQFAAFANDPALGGALLFGGQYSGGVDGDSWEFAAGHWVDLSPGLSISPPARRAALMTYDSTNGSVLLFGGDGGPQGVGLADTWRFESGPWFNLTGSLPESPAARFATSMTDDPSENGTLLFGGCTSVGCLSSLGDTWIWTDVPLSLQLSPPEVSGSVPLHVELVASATGGLPPYSFEWANGSAPLLPGGPSWNATFPVAGDMNVTVRLQDSGGGNDSAQSEVDATLPPGPLAVSLNVTSFSGVAPFTVRLRATIDGGRTPYSITWQNESNLPFMVGGTEWNATYDTPGNYTLTVSVRDANETIALASASVAVRAAPTVINTPSVLFPLWELLGLIAVLALVLVVAVLLLNRRRSRDGSGPASEPGPKLTPTDSSLSDSDGSSAFALPIGPVSLSVVSTPMTGPELPSDQDPPPMGPSPPLSNRILMRLLGLGPLGGSHLAPVGRTQEGIALALGKPQGSFARVLLRLEESGPVGREPRHVTGKTRRMQVYFLTDRGFEFTREIRQGRPTPSPAAPRAPN